MVRRTSKDLTILITETFLKNWQPDFLKVKYVYVRDALVKIYWYRRLRKAHIVLYLIMVIMGYTSQKS